MHLLLAFGALLGLGSFSIVHGSAASAPSSETLQSPAILVEPSSGLPGTKITIKGAGFDFPITAIYTVTITMEGRVIGEVPINTLGGFTAVAFVPAFSPGEVEITASGGGANRATTSFTILGPTIMVNPTSGTPSSSVAVTGTLFPVNSQVTGLTMSGLTILPDPVPNTDSSGKFTTTDVIVPNLPPGPSMVEATIGGIIARFLFEVESLPSTPTHTLTRIPTPTNTPEQPTHTPTPTDTTTTTPLKTPEPTPTNTPTQPIDPTDNGNGNGNGLGPVVIAAIIGAIATVIAAFLGYLGVRSTRRR